MTDKNSVEEGKDPRIYDYKNEAIVTMIATVLSSLRSDLFVLYFIIKNEVYVKRL